MLGDFAENYSFVVQDEVQGYHWNSSQCTLHPTMIYHKTNTKLQSHSLCYLSDDLTHDVNMVYEILKQTIQFTQNFICDNVSTVHYFSDGCAAQYKNCNLGVKCTWSFFTTSHGKSPCDGIGGTVKRLTSRASLQRPLHNQILNPQQMFEFCHEEIIGITMIFMASENLKVLRQKMTVRYQQHTSTIPGTRGYHHFAPLSATSIGLKRVSEQTVFSDTFYFNAVKVQPMVNIGLSKFVTCIYDDLPWIGVIVQEMDKTSFNWPSTEDICWVPITKVLCNIEAPTSTGRQYLISEESRISIVSHLENIK